MRDPIVGTGADGYRRSEQIIRDELDTLDADDPRRPALEGEAHGWAMRAQAAEDLERNLKADAGEPCVELVLRLELEQTAEMDEALEVLERAYRFAGQHFAGDVVEARIRAEGRRLVIPRTALEAKWGEWPT